MAGIGISFNANQYAERTHVSVVPPGWYRVQIVDSKIAPTKTPGGARLNLQFKILDGDFAGRVIFQGYNVKNNNPVAVNIAMEELAELSKAVGVPVWEDTQQLHAIPFNMKAKCKAEPGYDVRNEPQIYQHISNMDNVVYATKADIGLIPKAAEAKPAGGNGGGAFGGGAFGGGAAPAGSAFGQQQPAQQQQQTTQNVFGQQQQPYQQQQQQQPQTVNFQQAAQQQPWNAQGQQQQPQQQPAQQQQVAQQTQQQAAGWAQQQVQPGTEQPAQQQQQQQAAPEQPDEIEQAAQSQTPPWRQNAQ